VNQRQLQAFLMVMRHGSITSAAHALSISQPAVSRLIADLETGIGFSLFERHAGRIGPTPDARVFVREVERMFYGLDRLEQVAREIKDLRHAALSIATMPMVSLDIVPQAFATFLKRHSGIRITHNVHTSPRIIDLVSSNQIDLGIAQIEAERRDLRTLASYRTHCVCALAPDHRLAKRKVLTPKDLEGEPLVALAHHTLTAHYVDRSFAEANIVPTIAIESQPSYAACRLAAVGIGITIVDPMTPRVFGAQLRTVPFEPKIPFDFHVLTSIDLPLSRAATQFCDHLLGTLHGIRGVTRLAE
jgi:DNA-binding transcriptional LysR family regulator